MNARWGRPFRMRTPGDAYRHMRVEVALNIARQRVPVRRNGMVRVAAFA